LQTSSTTASLPDRSQLAIVCSWSISVDQTIRDGAYASTNYISSDTPVSKASARDSPPTTRRFWLCASAQDRNGRRVCRFRLKYKDLYEIPTQVVVVGLSTECVPFGICGIRRSTANYLQNGWVRIQVRPTYVAVLGVYCWRKLAENCALREWPTTCLTGARRPFIPRPRLNVLARSATLIAASGCMSRWLA